MHFSLFFQTPKCGADIVISGKDNEKKTCQEDI